MARRREPDHDHEAAVEVDSSPVSDAERLDERVTLDAPPEVVLAGPAALVRWATAHESGSVRSDEEALAVRAYRERHRAYTRARMEARRAERPRPDPRDFFGDGTYVSAA
jgi:hypothetical protein